MHHPSSLLYKLQVYQAVLRRWGRDLDSSHRMVLLHLVDMTVGWGWESVNTTVRQIVEGRKGNGNFNVAPIGLGKTTVKTALNVLRDKGLIETRNTHCRQTGCVTGLKITVNVELILAEWEREDMPPQIATPKRLKSEQAEIRPGVGQDLTGGGSEFDQGWVATRPRNTDTYTSNPTDMFHEDDADADASSGSSADADNPSGPGPLFADGIQEKASAKNAPEKSDGIVSVQGSLEKIKMRNRELRATALQAARARLLKASTWEKGRRKTDQVRGEDIETLWRETLAETSLGTVSTAAWTKKQRGMAMTLFNQWAKRDDGWNPNGAFVDFVEYVVSDWKGIIARKFGWMTKSPPPETPGLDFVQRFFSEFEDAFVTRERRKVLDKIDLSEVEELVAKGHGYDAALEIVAQRKIKTKVRAEVAKARPQARRPAPPPARPRSRPETSPVQPVATESGLQGGEKMATSVTRQLKNKRSAADWEAAAFGPKRTDSE